MLMRPRAECGCGVESGGRGGTLLTPQHAGLPSEGLLRADGQSCRVPGFPPDWGFTAQCSPPAEAFAETAGREERTEAAQWLGDVAELLTPTEFLICKTRTLIPSPGLSELKDIV